MIILVHSFFLTNIQKTFAVSTEVNGSRQYMHVGKVIDDFALNIVADVVDEKSFATIEYFDEGL